MFLTEVSRRILTNNYLYVPEDEEGLTSTFFLINNFMRILPILFIVFTAVINSFSQSVIKAYLLDEETKNPISYASVSLPQITIGTITNEEGYFSLTFAEPINTIIVSHINYGKKEIILPSSNEDVIKIYLKASVINLEEVVVTSTPIPTILKSIITESQQKISNPMFLSAYYREFVKRKNKYTKYSDGLLKYFLEKKRNGKIETVAWVDDSRAVELDNEEGEKIDLNLMSPLDIRDTFNNVSFGFLESYTEDKNINNYVYELTVNNTANGSISKLHISPKKGVELPLWEVTIFYETETKLILDVESVISAYNAQFFDEINMLVVKILVTNGQKRLIFKHSEDSYYPIYSLWDFSMIVRNKNKLNDQLRFTSDANVLELLPKNAEVPNEKDRYKQKSLYKNDKPTKTEFWKDSNAIKLTKEQEEVIESISK